MRSIETEFDKYVNFRIQTGLLKYLDFLFYGIELEFGDGRFGSDRLSYLMELCCKWPELHIVSIKKSHAFNRVVEGADYYYLANGVCDPDYTARSDITVRRDFEIMREEVLRIPESERTGGLRFMLAWAEAVLANPKEFDPEETTDVPAVS
jgi:hypothetical protein